MAKRFYILLYLFLSRTYKTWKSYTSAIIPRRKKSMNMSFLLAGNWRHHCFQRPETDGWVVKERYNPAQWNIYAAQASAAITGPMTLRFAMKSWRKNYTRRSLLQLYRNYPSCTSDTVREYEHLQSTFDNFAMQHIRARMIFIRCSVNCFINKMQQLRLKLSAGSLSPG